MGETGGWERANWFANAGQEREYRYSWKRQNWFENAAAEHRAVRENVGMYDMTSFGKLRVEGPDAEAFLNHVCGANLSVPAGKIVYTQFLNSRGGIEADVTVTRLSETAYLVVTPAATRLADQTWLMRHKASFNAVVTDVTMTEGVLAVMGPMSRDLLAKVSPNDFSNAVNPFGTAQEIEIGMGLARAHSVSYVGELGWEIYIPAEMSGHVFETLWEAGQDMGLKLCGMHMMDSCRIEKAFRHFGHDITCEDNVIDAGLGFAVDLGKADFMGKKAVEERKASGPKNRMVQFKLTDAEPLLYHNEPILRDGDYVGYLSSGNYGHSLGAAIGMGYVPCAGESAADVLASTYEIDVCGTKVRAEASLKPMYDPKSERVKA
jgi:4-methylaminobutanoate oxidase (formaldehyde-forming)